MIVSLVMISASVLAQSDVENGTQTGGGGKVSNASFRVHGTIGQLATGVGTHASNKVFGGFWELPKSLAVPALFRINGGSLQNVQLILDWNDGFGATSYDVQVATENTFASPFVDTTVTVSEYTFDTALGAGTYFWRVKAKGPVDSSPFTSEDSFVLVTLADPQGVTIAFATPDSGALLGIGGTIRVLVTSFPGTANLDTVIVGLSSGTSVILFGDIGLIDTLVAPTASSTTTDTFAVTFTVAAGDTHTVGSSIVVQVKVSVNGDNAGFKLLDNQMQLEIFNGLPDFGLVGDLKRIDIDGQRPVNTGFDSVLIDTAQLNTQIASLFGTRATADGPGGTQSVRSAGIGDMIRTKMHVDIEALDVTDIDSAKVFLVEGETAGYQVADSAFASFGVSAISLLGSAGVARDSFFVEEGQFETKTMSDNLRIKVLAFFVDAAGNLSASAPDSVNPEAFAMDILTVVDSRRPVVTPLHPDATGERFTGRIDTTMRFRNDDGTIDGSKTFDLNPLTFKVGEGTRDLRVIVAADTAVYGGSSSTDTLRFTTADSFSTPIGEIAGKVVDLELLAQDSVGNELVVMLKDVILDQVAPQILDLFPTLSALPESTITEETRHPRFVLSEAIDSLLVVFIENASTSIDLAIEAIANVSGLPVDEEIQLVLSETLEQGVFYTLQLVARDLAGNFTVTALDTLKFDDQFSNPAADSFIVELDTTLATTDSVIAGVNLPLVVTAIDTALSNASGVPRAAVTYKNPMVEVRADGGVQDVGLVVFGGRKIEDQGDGTAELVKDGWFAGSRKLTVRSSLILDDFSVVVEEMAGELGIINMSGRLDSLTVDAAEFSAFSVVAFEDGAETEVVSGSFEVVVTLTDAYGNRSDKAFDAAVDLTSADSLTASTNLLTTRIPGGNRLGEVWVDFAANHGDTRLPAGPSPVPLDGATFTVVTPEGEGEGMIVSVRTVGSPADTMGAPLPRTVAYGSTRPLVFLPAGTSPTPNVTPAAPDTLIVTDYLGADGKGDQGGYVVASFPRSKDEGLLRRYRIFRELEVFTDLDASGALVELEEPINAFVPWAVIDPIPPVLPTADDDELMHVIVPTIDSGETRWAVSGEFGENATALIVTKTVVTDPLAALGIEWENSDNKGKAIVRLTEKGEWFARLDIRPGPARKPLSLVSTKKAISALARAIDNIPPDPPTSTRGEVLDGGQVRIRWSPSKDDRVVGHVSYLGHSIALRGVSLYRVLASADGLGWSVLGQTRYGESEYVHEPGPEIRLLWIRVDSEDVDNRSPGEAIRLPIRGRSAFADKVGQDVHLVAPRGSTPLTQDFEDFLVFMASFGHSNGGPSYNLRADLDANGEVGFSDFVYFAEAYGRVAVTVNGAPAAQLAASLH